MPCFWPLRAKRQPGGNIQILGSSLEPRRLAWDFNVPCGQCTGCRLDHAKQWSLRCLHEASLHDANCFATLTYEYEPYGSTLVPEHFTKFMKRLRRARPGQSIRYYMCGEYGDKLQRPHYHACLFNLDFEDKQLWKIQNGCRLYQSDELEKIWGHGFALIGEVTIESAAYTARYVMKKLNGAKKENIDPQSGLSHYERLVEETGEIIQLHPEYARMSLKPAIGADWYHKFKRDCFPSDFLIDTNGKRHSIPRYYDKLFQANDLEQYELIKARRIRNGEKHLDNNTPDRLRDRETCLNARLNILKRPYEDTDET